MEFISTLASNFMGLFNAGGEQFVNWVTGIIPTVVCLMVAVNSIIKIIGEDRVTAFAQKCTASVFGRYLILPFLAVFCLGNPMMYTFGRFVDEKYNGASWKIPSDAETQKTASGGIAASKKSIRTYKIRFFFRMSL